MQIDNRLAGRGGCVYNVHTSGDVVVLATAKVFKEFTRNSFGETTYSTPTVAVGVVYLRTVSHLVSLGGKQ